MTNRRASPPVLAQGSEQERIQCKGNQQQGARECEKGVRDLIAPAFHPTVCPRLFPPLSHSDDQTPQPRINIPQYTPPFIPPVSGGVCAANARSVEKFVRNAYLLGDAEMGKFPLEDSSSRDIVVLGNTGRPTRTSTLARATPVDGLFLLGNR